MKGAIISDKDYQTGIFLNLNKQIIDFLNSKNFEIEDIAIGRDDLKFCMGCFGCWIKKPGECVINDRMSQVNRSFMNSDTVIYLCPVIFGQFSANIKNALDRWIPNILPFFITRPDGSTMHPSRYDKYPKQIMIGYGDSISEEDVQLFTDITKKHRSNIEVLFFQNTDTDISEQLNKIELATVGGTL
jgi:multimeric flavodoxin WrbA